MSGGDDRRVMLWQFGQALLNHGKPDAMKAVHQSNIFCLGITSDNQKIYSGGNDDIVSKLFQLIIEGSFPTTVLIINYKKLLFIYLMFIVQKIYNWRT